jgi:hypothetical protein
VSGQIQYVLGHGLTSETTPDGRLAPTDPELARRLVTFRHEIHEAGTLPVRTRLQRLLDRARELELRDEDIKDELAEIHASLEALDFADYLARHGLPTVAPIAELPHGESCHFVTPARFGRRRSDQCGHLELTTSWLKFRAALDMSIVWSEVADVRRVGRDIQVSLTDSRRPLRFCCPTPGEAVRGAVLAQHLLEASRVKSAGSDAEYHAAL